MLANIQTFANFLAPYLRYFNLPYTRVPPKLIEKMTFVPSEVRNRNRFLVFMNSRSKGQAATARRGMAGKIRQDPITNWPTASCPKERLTWRAGIAMQALAAESPVKREN